ncbi:hypothetical protein [Glycomyces salinus]|uniref:hypothetical protein n=1 Tax=Glycomyces salinus TaxID=980294 RepID=UPI0018EC3A19|nr:hypothetical protein [Glycomyces salinus]
MRTMRKAALVGGLATGALLFAGSGAQASEAAPEQLGGLPTDGLPLPANGLPVPTDAIPGLDAVPADQLPGVGAVLPQQEDHPDAVADKKHQGDDQQQGQAEAPAGPVDDLLGNLGGGLPVPLPF